jgi:hypothetical protein
MYLLECGYCHKLFSEDYMVVIDHINGHLCRHCAQVLDHKRGYRLTDRHPYEPPTARQLRHWSEQPIVRWLYGGDDE